MWSPVASQKITPFFSCVRLELYSLKPKAENKWEVPLASISLVFCLSYLGEVFENLDVVFVNSTETS